MFFLSQTYQHVHGVKHGSVAFGVNQHCQHQQQILSDIRPNIAKKN